MTKVIEAQFREWKPDHKKQKAQNLSNPINEDVIVIDKEHQTVVVAQLSLPTELEATTKKVQQIMRHKMKWGNLDSALSVQIECSELSHPKNFVKDIFALKQT